MRNISVSLVTRESVMTILIALYVFLLVVWPCLVAGSWMKMAVKRILICSAIRNHPIRAHSISLVIVWADLALVRRSERHYTYIRARLYIIEYPPNARYLFARISGNLYSIVVLFWDVAAWRWSGGGACPILAISSLRYKLLMYISWELSTQNYTPFPSSSYGQASLSYACA